jgi:spore maturation protein CgeB
MHVLAVLPPDRWMEINLLDTLRRHYCTGLHVFHYPGGMGQLGSPEWRLTRDELNHELLLKARDLHAAGQLDLIFFLVYDDFLLTETAKQLRELRVPMINYHVDMAFQWYRVIRTAPFFDVLAVAQMTNADRLKPYARHIHWMPMAANPDFYCSREDKQYRHQVSFVGSFNPYRRAVLDRCVSNSIRPVVYGRGWQGESDLGYRFDWDLHKIVHDVRYYAWPRLKAEGAASVLDPLSRKFSRRKRWEVLAGPEFRGPCQDHALPDIFRLSHINLGLSDTGWHSRNDVVLSGRLQCRLRDFEVPMAGGFYLVQEAPGHREYYRLGEEIETWADPDELVDKIGFYSRNQKSAERIRDAGQRRAMTCHTWKHRFSDLFKSLGLV